jgi:hypothetical protein
VGGHFGRASNRSKLQKNVNSTFLAAILFRMGSSAHHIGAFRPRSVLCLGVLFSVSLAAGVAQSQIGNGLPYPPTEPGLAPMNRTANPTADANRLMEDSMKQQDLLKQWEVINVKRQKDMTTDMAKLIELANQLKTETDRSAVPALSVLEIRKAEEIEKLAHGIQHKMRGSIFN